ncbi:MAG: type II toxin-antitoxin system YoeB family toxin [Solirubrobacteraceae bacterium MAG38_C4-C5]|nr:type II toxin-antitoxin system YoeB family toxin [Candidatus Siliceabacter maunaloa]
MRLVFTPNGWEDYKHWLSADRATLKTLARGMGVPFDVDLGPGQDGEVVAVYSRCRTEPDVIRVRDEFGARVFSDPYPAWTAGPGLRRVSLRLRRRERDPHRRGQHRRRLGGAAVDLA